MRRILVTGANGFVGRDLCNQLMARGFPVRAALRCGSLSAELKGVEGEVVGDLGPDTNWEKALVEVDCVVHLAARVHVMADKAVDPLAEFRRVNRDGTVCLVKQAAFSGVRRFIYLSSIKVNGEETKGHPFTAAAPPNPVDYYAVSKAEAEQQVLGMVGTGSMEVVIIRPPLVYGPGVQANFYKMMRIVGNGFPLPLGAIHNKRRLVALDNLVDLIITCIDHPAAKNQVFLAGDGEELSTTELLQRLSCALERPNRLLPIPQKIIEYCLKMLGKGNVAQRLCGSLQVDISKACDLLDWQAVVTVDEALMKTAEWYLHNKTKEG